MYLCKNEKNVKTYAAITKFTPCGLPVWFPVEVFASDIETAGFIFAAFHGLEMFSIEPVEMNPQFYSYNLN